MSCQSDRAQPKQEPALPCAQRSFGAQGEGESDELKRVLLEGNPYFLALTTVVSLLHSVFDLLAFKNDIGFWKGKKNVEGLSVRTVGINCACQARTRMPACLHACTCNPLCTTSSPLLLSKMACLAGSAACSSSCNGCRVPCACMLACINLSPHTYLWLHEQGPGASTMPLVGCTCLAHSMDARGSPRMCCSAWVE